MTKRKRIIYWVATIWLALGMASTGIVQLLGVQTEVDFVTHLGYPAYFVTILGVWKLAGVVVVLVPGVALLKEWAYAGFFFTVSGAIMSHMAVGRPGDMFPAVLLLVLTATSWFLRPAGRQVVNSKQ